MGEKKFIKILIPTRVITPNFISILFATSVHPPHALRKEICMEREFYCVATAHIK